MGALYNCLTKRLQLSQLPSSWIISSDNINLAYEELLEFLNIELLKSSIKVHDNSDILIIKRILGNRDINIEQIRNLQQFFYSTSGLSDYKIAVIIEADLMNNYASNACLKFLEEVKNNNYIFLLTRNPLSLPITIRSRCLFYNIPVDQMSVINNEVYLKFIESILNKRYDLFFAELKNKNRELWLELTEYSCCLISRLIKKNLLIIENLLDEEQKIYNKMQNQQLDFLYKKLCLVYRIMQNTIKYDLDLVSNYVVLIEEIAN